MPLKIFTSKKDIEMALYGLSIQIGERDPEEIRRNLEDGDPGEVKRVMGYIANMALLGDALGKVRKDDWVSSHKLGRN